MLKKYIKHKKCVWHFPFDEVVASKHGGVLFGPHSLLENCTYTSCQNKIITNECYSIVTCKVLLNWPQPEVEQHCAALH